MARDKGTANVGFKFEPRTASPLDARQVVDYVSDLTDIETWKSDNGNYYYYEGMEVYVKENKKRYTLTSDNPANINNWKQEGSGGSNDDHVELTQAQYDALTEEEKMNGKVYFITDAAGGGSGSGTVTTDVEAGWNLDKSGNMLSVNRQVPSITVDQDSAQVSIKAVKENGNAEELRLKTYPDAGYTGLYTGNDDDPNTTNVTANLQHKIEAGRAITIGADGKTIGVNPAVPGLHYADNGKYATIRNGTGENGERLAEVAFNNNKYAGGLEFSIKDKDGNASSRILQEKIVAGNGLTLAADGKTLHTNFVGQNGIVVSNTDRTIKLADSVVKDIAYIKANPSMQAYAANEVRVGSIGSSANTEDIYGKSIQIFANQLNWQQTTNKPALYCDVNTDIRANHIIRYQIMLHTLTQQGRILNRGFQPWDYGVVYKQSAYGLATIKQRWSEWYVTIDTSDINDIKVTTMLRLWAAPTTDSISSLPQDIDRILVTIYYTKVA